MKHLKLILIVLSLLVFSGCAPEGDFTPTNDAGTGVTVVSLLNDSEIEGTLITTEVDHWANHQGELYSKYFNFTFQTGQTQKFMLCNNNDTHFHLIHMHLGSDSGPIRAEFWENPTILTNGTLTNMTRLNRGVEYNNNTIGVKYYVSPTTSSDGTLLYVDWLLGTNNRAENIFNLPAEWIFEHNTCYILNIVNENGNNVFIHGAFSGINVEAH